MLIIKECPQGTLIVAGNKQFLVQELVSSVASNPGALTTHVTETLILGGASVAVEYASTTSPRRRVA
jgi:hypothetical protein